MNVITKNPIKYARTSSADGLNNFSLMDDIKQFQDWLDVNIQNWVWDIGLKKNVPLNKAVGKYGFFGPNTQNAWNTYGSQYIAFLKSAGKKVPQIIEPSSTGGGSNPKDTQPSSNNSTSTTPKEEDKEKKKMKLGVKIAIGVGIVAIIGGIVYFATRKK